jgi:hypothetical protein
MYSFKKRYWKIQNKYLRKEIVSLQLILVFAQFIGGAPYMRGEAIRTYCFP